MIWFFVLLYVVQKNELPFSGGQLLFFGGRSCIIWGTELKYLAASFQDYVVLPAFLAHGHGQRLAVAEGGHVELVAGYLRLFE